MTHPVDLIHFILLQQNLSAVLGWGGSRTLKGKKSMANKCVMIN